LGEGIQVTESFGSVYQGSEDIHNWHNPTNQQ